MAQEAADQGTPPLPQHQMLNLGLMLMGFGHVAILAPLWSTAEAGPLLHYFVAFWSTVRSSFLCQLNIVQVYRHYEHTRESCKCSCCLQTPSNMQETSFLWSLRTSLWI